MRMIGRSSLAVSCIVALTSSIPCQAFTGNDLHRWGSGCTNSVAGECFSGSLVAYVAAISDTFNGVAFCLPEGSTYQQMGDVVIKSLNSNPETREKSASFLVIELLKKTYPCVTQK